MKIGFLSAPGSGHLNPMTTLGRKIQSRGNEVLFIGIPDIKDFVDAAKLPFLPYGEEEYPLGSIARIYGPVARLRGQELNVSSIEMFGLGYLQATLKHLPGKLAGSDIQGLVIDRNHWFSQLVPMGMAIPFVQIWTCLPTHPRGLAPPAITDWPHEMTPEALARNEEGLKQRAAFLSPLLPVARSYAEEVSLYIDWADPCATDSKLAIITQSPEVFDYPDIPWPAEYHYSGPFYDGEGREPVPFEWEKLDGRPLIYASLGTIVNGINYVHEAIIAAAEKLPEVQLVFAVGKNVNLASLGTIPSNTIIVRAAPQIELLKRASLCVTHAGLNTTLEALGLGVPLVAIPFGYDQPGNAARIAYHRVGEFMRLEDFTASGLLALICKVLNNPSYREKAGYFREAIAAAKGLDVACDVIESVFSLSNGDELRE